MKERENEYMICPIMSGKEFIVCVSECAWREEETNECVMLGLARTLDCVGDSIGALESSITELQPDIQVIGMVLGDRL